MDRDARDELEELYRQVANLEARLARFQSSAGTGSSPPQRNRRDLLKTAGMAAAAVAGGAAGVAATAQPAHGANGDPLTAGATTNATASTILSGSSEFHVNSSNNHAVVGNNTASTNGIGVAARASGTDSVGLSAESSSGPAIRVEPGPAMPPNTGGWQAGDVVQSAGALWYCYVGGTGTGSSWVKISSALVTLPQPKRVYDSRVGQLPAILPKTPLEAGIPRTIDLKGNSSGVPTGITSALLSLVATGTTTGTGGFMSVYRAGIAFPGTSNLNWSGPNETVAVTTVSAVDAQSRVDVYAGSETDLVIDVIGFYP